MEGCYETFGDCRPYFGLPRAQRMQQVTGFKLVNAELQTSTGYQMTVGPWHFPLAARETPLFNKSGCFHFYTSRLHLILQAQQVQRRSSMRLPFKILAVTAHGPVTSAPFSSGKMAAMCLEVVGVLDFELVLCQELANCLVARSLLPQPNSSLSLTAPAWLVVDKNWRSQGTEWRLGAVTVVSDPVLFDSRTEAKKSDNIPQGLHPPCLLVLVRVWGDWVTKRQHLSDESVSGPTFVCPLTIDMDFLYPCAEDSTVTSVPILKMVQMGDHHEFQEDRHKGESVIGWIIADEYDMLYGSVFTAPDSDSDDGDQKDGLLIRRQFTFPIRIFGTESVGFYHTKLQAFQSAYLLVNTKKKSNTRFYIYRAVAHGSLTKITEHCYSASCLDLIDRVPHVTLRW